MKQQTALPEALSKSSDCIMLSESTEKKANLCVNHCIQQWQPVINFVIISNNKWCCHHAVMLLRLWHINMTLLLLIQQSVW